MSGDKLRFLLVTKSAAVDFPHAARCCDSFPCHNNDHGESAIYKRDTAGNYIKSAKSISNTIISGKLDYKYDHDWFRRANSGNTTYSEVLLSSKNSKMILDIYDSNGELVKTINGNQTGVGLQMTGQQTYYFDVYSTAGDIQNYILIFS